MMANTNQIASKIQPFEPVAMTQAPHNETQAEILLAQYTGSKNILLVDDDPINRLVGLDILDFPGLQVITANDGLDAVELVSLYHFDLILMDIHMPRMDGIEAVRRIRQMAHGMELPIIALTADSEFQNIEYVKSLNMSDSLLKPIYPDLLYQKLLRWLKI